MSDNEKEGRVDPVERLLNIREAAEFLNVSEMSIRRWTNSGALKCYRLGGKRERRFHVSDLVEFLQGLQGPKLAPLGYRALKAPDGSHLTHFYSGQDEALEVSVPYVLAGLERNEFVLVVMPPERSRGLMNDLERQGRSIHRDLQKGRLRLSTGMDSPKEMIRYLAGFMERTKKFRVVGDMIWALGKGWDLAALGTFEKVAGSMPRPEGGFLLCQYSLTDFYGAHIMMAAESHTHMIYKGGMEEGLYYRQRNEPGKRDR